MSGARRARRRNGTPRRLLIFFLAAPFLAACNGDSTGPLGGDLFLRFKANGAQVEFTDQLSLLASFTSTTAQSVLLITGFEGPSNAGLQIYDRQPITTSTYSGYAFADGAFQGVLVTYLTPSNVLYQLDTSAPVDATVTITDIGSARIRGTFSGTLSDGQTDLVITDGEFLVARAN
jgi:hypothetical protein